MNLLLNFMNSNIDTHNIFWGAIIGFLTMMVCAGLSLWWYLSSSQKMADAKNRIIKEINIRDGFSHKSKDNYKERFSKARKKAVDLEADKKLNFFAKGQPSFAIICGILSILIGVSALYEL